MVEALLLAVALAADAFAVALGQGARFRPGLGAALALALAFGLAQGAMAAIGWALGAIALDWIAAWDHWIAFALLAGIGGYMILGDADEASSPLLGPVALLAAAIATSIDALAAGIALPAMAVDPVLTIALIAGVALVLSLCGIWLGRAAGERFGRSASIAGGFILIALGCRIVLDHTGAI
jgi:putative Mn2+ efflux pump MntP